MLAAVSTQQHPYHVQVFTFWLALIPIAILLVLMLFATIWHRRRTRRRSRT